VVGDDQAEHGVAQELEALVRGRALGLGAPGAVGQGPLQQLGVVEAPAEPVRQGVEVQG
jgi:hypothetical protein